ncbi:nSTAND1 domain-containing NTPase [Sorangium sp. KYC3313]|uniref:nSTAND1 domain-containing NTPase n=1 Tax=Sorangium sp. KYC3313 TaxID=3449740 RepID=UPI003F8B488F
MSKHPREPAAFNQSIAVVIGIKSYSAAPGVPAAHRLTDLETAVRDAEAVAEALEADHGYEVRLLLEDEATKKGILRAVLRARRELGEPARFLLYFAGHGVALNQKDGRRGYLAPYGARRDDDGTLLKMETLEKAIAGKGNCLIRARHVLIILDCCFAGAFRWASTRDVSSVSVLYRSQLRRFVESRAWQILCSTAHNQEALDSLGGHAIGRRDEGGEHSPFASALLRGLAGGADRSGDERGGGDGVITATELYVYLRDAVELGTLAHGFKQTPGLWPGPLHDRGENVFLLRPEKDLKPADDPRLDRSTNPYRDLRPFEHTKEDAALFFGRERAVAELILRVESAPLTLVVGPGGNGKSSLVRAGLPPALERAEGSAWVLVPPFRPGTAPLESLAAALSAALRGAHGERVSAADLARSSALAELVSGILEAQPVRGVLLVIDPLDDLETKVTDREVRRAFLQLLREAMVAHAGALRVVATLRADFEPILVPRVGADATGWEEIPSEVWQAARFVVSPMTHGELTAAIERPAARCALFFNPSQFVERLIRDVWDRPGALPLLSSMLSELYLKCLDEHLADPDKERALLETAYTGVARVLSCRAEAVYTSLGGDAERRTMKWLMLRMVEPDGEWLRRKVPLRELESELPGEARSVAALRVLLERDKLVIAGSAPLLGPYIELAHEELVTGWPTLAAWRGDKEENEALRLHRELTEAALRWESTGRNLWVLDARLGPARRMRKSEPGRLSRTEAAFLDASVLRQRLSYAGVALFAVAGLGLGASLWDERRLAHSGRLASEALGLLDIAPVESVEMAMEATRVAVTKDSVYALRRAVMGSRLRAVLDPADGPLFAATFSPDGERILTIGEDAVSLWDSSTYERIQRFTVEKRGTVEQALLSSDRESLLLLRRDTGEAELRDVTTATRLGDRAPAVQIHRGPGGELRLVAVEGSGDGAVTRVLERRDGAWAPIVAVRGQLAGVSRNGGWLVVAQPDLVAASLDPPTAEQALTAPPEHPECKARSLPIRWKPVDLKDEVNEQSGCSHVSVSTWKIEPFYGGPGMLTRVSVEAGMPALFIDEADMTPQALVNTWPGTRLLNLAEEGAVVRLADESWVTAALFGSTEGKLLTINPERARLWRNDIQSSFSVGRVATDLRGLTGKPSALAWSEDQRLAATGSTDGTTAVWDVFSGARSAVLRGHAGEVRSVAFHPRAATVLTASSDGEARLWHVDAPEVILTRQTPETPGPRAEFQRCYALGEDRALVSVNNVLELHDLRRGHPLAITRPDVLADAAMSADGSTIVTISSEELRLWDVAARPNSPLFRLSHDEPWSRGARFHRVFPGPDAALLMLVMKAPAEELLQEAVVWDVRRGGVLGRVSLSPVYAGAVAGAWSADGTTAATAAGREVVFLHGVSSRDGATTALRQGRVLRGHTAAVFSVAFRPDGGLVATGDELGEIRVWSVETGAPVATLLGHVDRVHALHWADDHLLVSASGDGSVRVWDTEVNRELTALWGSSESVLDARLSADGKSVVAATRTSVLRFPLEGAVSIDELRRVARSRIQAVTTPASRPGDPEMPAP